MERIQIIKRDEMVFKFIKKLYKEFFGGVLLVIYILAVALLEFAIIFTEISINYPLNTFTGFCLLLLGITLPLGAVFLIRFTQKIKARPLFK